MPAICTVPRLRLFQQGALDHAVSINESTENGYFVANLSLAVTWGFFRNVAGFVCPRILQYFENRALCTLYLDFLF